MKVIMAFLISGFISVSAHADCLTDTCAGDAPADLNSEQTSQVAVSECDQFTPDAEAKPAAPDVSLPSGASK